MTRTQPRRSRFSPAAAVACLLSLLVAGLALWGLLRDPVPALADFDREGVPVTAPADPAASTQPPEPTRGSDPAAEPAADPTSEPTAGRAPSALDRPATRPASLEASTAAKAPPAPVRLRVPALGLDVPLDAVGVAPDGQMEVPEDADVAGWYKFGARPADDTGSVVVAGHVDDREGPGAFLALTRAQEGEEVVVELEDGSELSYTVTARTTTDKKELPVDDLFDRDGPPRLQLITCTGDWSASTGRYTDNLVLTATPAP
ncbi:class F sortase [Serinicoccus sp. LYQ131]|uniref:class F sortase n=1 Tax=Serinicoccus sp. LYQ131 TaxID=3378797 RepID=UPI003852E54B